MNSFDIAKKEENITSGFRNYGLWLYDPQVVCCTGFRKCPIDFSLIFMTRLNSAIRLYIL